MKMCSVCVRELVYTKHKFLTVTRRKTIMYIFNVFDHISLTTAIIDELKARGVKYKLPKKVKTVPNPTNTEAAPHVFNTSIKNAVKTNVGIKDGQTVVEVPEFLVDACTLIEKSAHVEGIFRKGGSANKQKELKRLINSGTLLDESCHVVDVCNLVKLYFRELPEPIIPFYCHDMLLGCMVLQGESAQREALLLSCLLLQLDHLSILVYFLEFLARIAAQSHVNKMDAKNLATVLAPSLMPLNPKVKVRSDFNFRYHISVIEMLILNAAEVGAVSPGLAEKGMCNRKKKRRSASISRMFTGIRKIVGRASSPFDESPSPQTVDGLGPRKRKSTELMPPAVTVKRRREIADTTPQMCRMGGYSRSSLRRQTSDCMLNDGISPFDVLNTADDNINTAVTCGPSSRTINKKRQQGLKPSKSTGNLFSSKRKSLERRLSNMNWRRRRSSKADTGSPGDLLENDLVTIPRQEYEDMKTRVNSMAKLLVERQKEENDRLVQESEHLARQLDDELHICLDANVQPDEAAATAVQEAFERAVEKSEQFEPQLGKDARLRWSSEQKVARSPSQRKIGSIRRRSKELARSNSNGSRSNLQRGRPNTRQTGLRSPGDLNCATRSRSRQASPADQQWQPAKSVLASKSYNHLRTSPDRRMSIVSLRTRNVGMVQAKAKFFNSLNNSCTDSESDRSSRSGCQNATGVSRADSVLKENRQPVIKAALATQRLKTPRSQIRSSMRTRATPLKALPDNVTTPLRSVRRSPRILARSLSQVRP